MPAGTEQAAGGNWVLAVAIPIATFLWTVYGENKSSVTVESQPVGVKVVQNQPIPVQLQLPNEPIRVQLVSPKTTSVALASMHRSTSRTIHRVELRNDGEKTARYTRLYINPASISYAQKSEVNRMNRRNDVGHESERRRITLNVRLAELQAANSSWWYVDVQVPPHSSRIVDITVNYLDWQRYRVLPRVEGTLIFTGDQGESAIDTILYGNEYLAGI